MALVTFVDDTPPYLNAQNLNNNFNELNSKASNKIGMTATLNSATSVTVSTAYNYVRVPLDTIKYEKDPDNVVSLASNQITINKTGTYLVSGQVMCKSSNANQVFIATTYSTPSQLGEAYVPNIKANSYQTITLAPVVVNLTAGQQVWFSLSGASTGDVDIAASKRFTCLSVVEI